ncbi:nucleotide exchange factor GrpE [Luteimonas sp. BDR2-5]|uniref:nucleotide exchange factor GrpE n=1 Tax=Proluteimonas luteida TaxID=2878685 RepID=UPI001E3C4B14|nr:nucleotide exchange factor GrpE [Luteimonas sp. BDR2-5]MCD9026878.1 nucleotide exchange factor GrpE [Luteimonas sp. BDR2-5]
MTQYNTDPNQTDPAAGDNAAGTEEARLAEQVEQLSAELEQLKAQTLLERADLENQRKRLGREVETARRFANERLLSGLVPVFDALEAGLASAPENDPLRAGVELTLRELVKATEAHGLTTVAPAAGEPFNPEHHQAMSIVDVPGVAPGAVAQVFQKGYLLNDRLLRPAMVVVAKAD